MAVKTKKKWLKGDVKDLLFYILIMAWPVAQFCVFYIGVNFNSFLIAFQDINLAKDTTTWTLQNFVTAGEKIISPTHLNMAKNSLLAYGLTVITSIPLGLLFSYYIYKRMPGAGAFRVILFTPSIVSSIIMVSLFRFFMTDAMPAMVKDFFHVTITPPLDNTEFWPRFGTIMFYNIWVGFGTSVLMYSNKMSSIDPSIPEAASIDGASGFTEFLYVTFPMVFSTMSVFIITGVAQIFTNQINLFSFYGGTASPKVQTFGYWLYNEAKNARADGLAGFSELSAIGLILTAVAVPLTLGVKWLVEKFGPSED